MIGLMLMGLLGAVVVMVLVPVVMMQLMAETLRERQGRSGESRGRGARAEVVRVGDESPLSSRLRALVSQVEEAPLSSRFRTLPA